MRVEERQYRFEESEIEIALRLYRDPKGRLRKVRVENVSRPPTPADMEHFHRFMTGLVEQLPRNGYLCIIQKGPYFEVMFRRKPPHGTGFIASNRDGRIVLDPWIN